MTARRTFARLVAAYRRSRTQQVVDMFLAGIAALHRAKENSGQ